MESEDEDAMFYSAESTLPQQLRPRTSCLNGDDESSVVSPSLMPNEFQLLQVIQRKSEISDKQESVFEIRSEFPMTDKVIYHKLKYCIEIKVGGKVKNLMPVRRLWKVLPDKKSFQFGYETDPGAHAVRVKIRGRHVQGSPLKFHVGMKPDVNNNNNIATKEDLMKELREVIRELYNKYLPSGVSTSSNPISEEDCETPPLQLSYNSPSEDSSSVSSEGSSVYLEPSPKIVEDREIFQDGATFISGARVRRRSEDES